MPCQHLRCSVGRPPSTRRCLDASLCAELGEIAPPLLLCKACADDVEQVSSRPRLRPLLMPMAAANIHTCQNKVPHSSLSITLMFRAASLGLASPLLLATPKTVPDPISSSHFVSASNAFLHSICKGHMRRTQFNVPWHAYGGVRSRRSSFRRW